MSICVECGKLLLKVYKRRKVCGEVCRKKRRKRYTREAMRLRRYGLGSSINESCQVCKFRETIDIHHEGEDAYILCPNHHALITRNIKKIVDYNIIPITLGQEDLLKEKIKQSNMKRAIIRKNILKDKVVKKRMLRRSPYRKKTSFVSWV